MSYFSFGRLSVAKELANFINQDVLPGTGLDSENLWHGIEALFVDFTPKNQALLNKRQQLQQAITRFHQSQPEAAFAEYKAFLNEIGYLVQQPENVNVTTENVDDEIARIAGPQLVVPINNARYALNAVNARWGSLYDALYGTDAIAETPDTKITKEFNAKRGAEVIRHARHYLDIIAPLQVGSHLDSIAYRIENGNLVVILSDQSKTHLKPETSCIGYGGSIEQPDSIVLKHHQLHIELQFDENHPVGSSDPAKIKDIMVESAITTIMDCEDSVAAVDAEDKVLVYKNWLGLIQGDLQEQVKKGDRTVTRKMNADRIFTSIQAGNNVTLQGRSLMFVRNVGHLMTTDAIKLDGQEVPEGIMDGIFTCLISKHDLMGNSPFSNSRTGSIYVVKPKMHGPEEVAFTNDLFAAVEDLIDVPRFTIKMGIMDEERRTSVNLKACINEAKERVVFINTGFLDRTGDEIHTSMHAGCFEKKAQLKLMPWIQAYEKANVATGLNCGLSGKAQIGKGMWPIPDQMAAMLDAKVSHPQSGANTAWVPSPTAATLHALHYHQVDVFAEHEKLAQQPVDVLDDILQVPLCKEPNQFNDEEIQAELDNNIQGILGYVVRWVHQGIGCSKVPDINNVGLMEDRATLRISAQHIANWLLHGVVTEQQIMATMERMAILVDQQNEGDPEYIRMTPNTANSVGFRAAKDLILLGAEQPSGYTEPLLHKCRREMKQLLAS